MQPHVIEGLWLGTGTELELPPGLRPSVFMLALDAPAERAVQREKVRVFGRRLRRGRLLDDPPIERPNLDNAQPVESVRARGPR
jgi:hypothetical protein